MNYFQAVRAEVLVGLLGLETPDSAQLAALMKVLRSLFTNRGQGF